MHKVVQAAYDELTIDSEFYNSKGKGQPRLLIMSGLPMSGKSYLSNLISEEMHGKVCIVRTDFIRPTVAKHMGRDEPIYVKEEHEHVFDLGHHMIKNALENGWPTIADATNTILNRNL